MKPIVDRAVRERVVERTDLSMALTAGAGAGKTTVLVDRVLSLLERGTAPERIAVITFTEKAAGEVASRVRDRLEARIDVVESPVRERLEDAVRALPDLTTSTIHAFARALLVREAFEADWAPGTELAADTLVTSAVDEAFRAWRRGFDDRHGASVPELRNHTADQTVRSAALELLRFRDLEAVVGPAEVDWRAAHAELATRVASLISYREGCRKPATCKLLGKNADALEELGKALERGRAAQRGSERGASVPAGGPDAVVPDFREAVERALRAPKLASHLGRAADWSDDSLASFRAECKAISDWQARWQNAKLAPLHRTIVQDLQAHFLPRVADEKRRRSQADYDDLLFECRDLLAQNAAARARLAARFDALLVDEVQDTDPIQAEIALLLTRAPHLEGAWDAHPPEPGRLFAVGDEKQSIYRFRRADVATWTTLANTIARGGERSSLQQSFRSVPGIVAFVNHVFAKLPGYEPVAPHREPAELDPVVMLRADRGEETVGAVRHVRDLIARGARVVDASTGAHRPVRPSDVMVLLPAWTNANGVLDAFIAAQIPAVVEGGAGLFDRDEVRLALAALRAIDEPGDAEAIVFVLRGLFGLSHEHLARHVAEGGTWRYTQAPQPAGPVAHVLTVLREVHRERRRKPLGALLDLLLARSLAPAVWSLMPRGISALANLDKIRELIRRLEATVETSAEVISVLLQTQRDKSRQDELSIADPDVDAVRIATLFGAKGREAPVVVVVHARRKDDSPIAVVDRSTARVSVKMKDLEAPEHDALAELEKAASAEERRRWMYVAATRARDQLVISHSEESKLLEADFASTVAALGNTEHDGLQKIGEGVSVRLRVPRLIPDPGQIKETFPGHDATVDRLLSSPAVEVDADEALWSAAQREAVKNAERASVDWRSVTEDVTSTRRFRGSGIGREGGRIVHRVMESFDLSRPVSELREAAEQLTAIHAQRADASPALTAKCLKVVNQLLGHEVIDRARSAPDRWQEVEVAYEKDGRIISGTIDLCFPTDASRKRWVVVDWKSDLPAAGSPERVGYERQVKRYAEALIASLVDQEIAVVDCVLAGPHAELEPNVRTETSNAVRPELAEILDQLLEAGAPMPEVGREIGGIRFELVWPVQRLALGLDVPAGESGEYEVVSVSTAELGWAERAGATLGAHFGASISSAESIEPEAPADAASEDETSTAADL